MKDQDKTKQQLIAENEKLRRRVAELEASRPNAGNGDGRWEPNNPQWHSLVANTPVFILVLDQNQCIRFANHTDSGATPNEIIGKPLYDFCRPEDRESVRECVQRVFVTGESAVFEGPGLRLDGREHWYASHFGPILEDGKVVAVSAISMNVTDRRRAELALRESERRLSTLMSTLPGMAYRCNNDPNWTMEFVSEGCLPLTGYESCELVGNRVISYGDLIQPDDRKSVWEQVQLAVAERRHFQLEYRILTADGQEKWVWEQGSPVFSRSEELEALEGFITDITERKRAEEELAKSNAILQATIDSLPFDFFAIGPDGRYIMQNATSKEHWGHAVGRRPEEVCSNEDDLAIWQANNRRAFGGEKVEAEVTLTFHGEKRFCHNVVTPIRSGKELFGILGINIDITERKQAEVALRKAHDELERRVEERTAELTKANEALRLSEKKYRMLIEASPDAVVMSDPQMRMVFASPEAVHLYGAASEEEMCGQTMVSFIVEEERPQAIAGAAILFEQGLRRNSKYTFLRKDGTRFPCELSSAVVMNDLNQPTAVISIVRDITERKQAQDVLERERQSLWRMLQASDHERQLIAYDIHDGLAQYLTGAIMQYQAHNALRENEPDEAKKAAEIGIELLRQAHSEARRLISEVRPPVIDENGIETAISHLVHEHRRHGGPKIECHTDVQFDRLASILENALYRIVQEALTNACKHSKSKKVMVTMTQEGQDVRLEVQDWGIGFDTESVEKGHFGLEGIRQRVRLLGGRLTIDSTPGSGTLIQVVVPIVERQKEG